MILKVIILLKLIIILIKEFSFDIYSCHCIIKDIFSCFDGGYKCLKESFF